MADNREADSLVPRGDDAAGDYADLAALFMSAVPVVGGAVSMVLSGWSAERRYQRIREVLGGLARDLAHFKGQVREEYVRSDEFVDLLDQTLRRVATERNEAKRRLYRGLLLGAVTSEKESYDEQLHTLRVIDSLQAAHIAVLRAILEEPRSDYNEGISGSFMETLRSRLRDLSEERITDLVGQLNDHHVVNLGSLQSMMTARGAQDMRGTITPFGKRLVSYLREEGPSDGSTR
jgi:flagellar biosynthesis chaperone FliJ